MADNLTDLPPVPPAYDGGPAGMLARMREALQVLRGDRGDPLDKAITWREALAKGIAALRYAPGTIGGGGTLGPPDDSGTPDLTPPPNVSGLAASASISHVIVEFDAPTYTQGHGNERTDIYGVQRDPLSLAAPPVFADAAVVTSATGASPIVALSSNPNTKWFLWAKYVSVDGVASVSPAGGTNGVQVTTGQDVHTLLDALTAAAFNPASPYDVLALRADLFTICPTVNYYQSATPGSPTVGQLWLNPATGITQRWSGSAWVAFPVNPPFFVTTVPIVQNGITCPPGVYMTSAFIGNGTIGTAQIGFEVVDDSKIANCSVAKLTAGSIAVGEYAQSTGFVSGSAGWQITGNGNAEFSGVIVRGTVFASSGSFTGSIFAASGTIAGNTITGSDIHSPGFAVGSTGWELTSSGIVYATSLHVLDATGLRIFNTDAVGANPVLKIGTAIVIDALGNATFGGSLTASNIVTTANLQPNSATLADVDAPAGSISVPVGGSTVVATKTITTLGSDAVLIFANAFLSTASGASTSSLGVYRDGVLLFTDSDNAATGLKFVWSGIDLPAAGAHTYTIEGTATSAGCNASTRTLGLLHAMR